MAAKFEDSKKYDLGKDELIQQVKRALTHCQFQIKNINEEERLIHAKSKLSFWSWTEKIEIKMEESGNVIMKSECSFPLQILDWGKNRRNVENFFDYLG